MLVACRYESCELCHIVRRLLLQQCLFCVVVSRVDCVVSFVVFSSSQCCFRVVVSRVDCVVSFVVFFSSQRCFRVVVSRVDPVLAFVNFPSSNVVNVATPPKETP